MSLENQLLKWYLINKRDLPWRKNKDPYSVWISEIILQQTRVSQGTQYYNNFMKRFPNIEELSISKESEVLKLWQGLGYYNRAINLHKTSKEIFNNLKGIFPSRYEDLIKLKGIGDYTASAISSICFDEYNPVVDGNVLRFLSRYFGIKDPIDSKKTQSKVKEIGKKLIDKTDNPGDFNQAMMEFGALICTPFPDCNTCPLGSKCVALDKNEVEKLPVKLKKKKIKERFLNYIVLIDKKNNTIVEKRVEKDIWFKLNQFPLIETNFKVDDIMRISSFIKFINSQKTPIKIEKYSRHNVKHVLSHQILQITFHKFKIEKEISSGINLSQLSNYNFPVPINNFINKKLL
jgi:A/G-specific adenine glycosylase|tara:strand:- start:2589 stop:3629 length:1041 start_codon:yes stop_codon:yes gene_type:complete